MNLRTALFLPLLKPKAGFRTGFYFSDYMRTQWLDCAGIEDLQKKKLLRLLNSVCSLIPYYSDYSLRIKGAAETARSILEKLPILTKEAIRESSDKMRSKSVLGATDLKASTGGTTGLPIEIWKDQQSLAYAEAAYWRGKQWLGIKPWHKGLVIQGFGRGSWYGRLRMRIARKWSLEAFRASESERFQAQQLLNSVQPRYIEGFVTDLLRLSETHDVSGSSANWVITTGEMLYDHQRLWLEERFGARVSEYYGSNEINSIAYECEKGMKHITDEHVIVETVDSLGNAVWDVPGRILVTDLDNFLMPLIRYELGDLGILTKTECECGRKLTVLKKLMGRAQDAIRNASGESLSALFFAGKFRNLRKINRFQLIQYNVREVELHYEATETDVDDEIFEIVGEIHRRLGTDLTVLAKQATSLRLTPRGKCMLIIGMNPDRIDVAGLELEDGNKNVISQLPIEIQEKK
jgi:phenylacetate-CoA ligase